MRRKDRGIMKTTANTVLFGLVALAGLLAAGPAMADRLNFGLGISNGEGGFFSFGLSNGDRHGGHGYPSHCAPRPGYYMPPPVICLPPPVVYVSRPAVQSGYWVEREQRVWVEGFWLQSVDAYGRRCKTWQPGRWEISRTREWVQQ